MSFTITIIETKEVVEVAGKEWRKLDDVEVVRETGMYDVRSDDDPKTRIKEIMGYTPEIEKRVIKEVEILKQVVEDLDLAAVIKAVNKI